MFFMKPTPNYPQLAGFDDIRLISPFVGSSSAFFMKPTPDYPQLIGFEELAEINPFTEFALPIPSNALRIDPSGTLMQGYPFVFDYVKPLELPTVASASINSGFGYITQMQSIIVNYAGITGATNQDALVVQLIDNITVLHENRISLSSSDAEASVAINADALEMLPRKKYTVKAFIDRNRMDYCIHAFAYTVTILPTLSVNKITPVAVQKPINVGANIGNQNLVINYTINNPDNSVKQVASTFELGNFEANATLRREELFAVTGTANSTGRDFSFTFDVTDSDFRLNSFAFRINTTGNVSIHAPMVCTVDEIEVMSGIFLLNAFFTDGLLRVQLSEPISLALGSHTIRLFNDENTVNWTMRSLTLIPTAHGFTITSTPIFEMEMAYSISTNISNSNNIPFIIDDGIPVGEHGISVHAIAELEGLGAHTFATEAHNTRLRVDRALLYMGSASLTRPARYIGQGVDNEILLSGMEDIEDGDELRVRVHHGEIEFYNETDLLSNGATSHTHIIPAEMFNTQLTTAGDYSVTITVTRGAFIDERVLIYTVVPIPTVTSSYISADRINLPAESPTSLSVSWAVNSPAGSIGSIQGSAFIVDTAFLNVDVYESDDINSDSMTFESVFPDIWEIQGGLYNIRLAVTVTSSNFGTVTISENRLNTLTVAYDGIPGISSVIPNFIGRYVGAEVNVAVNVRLFNVITGDQLMYELKNGHDVIHSATNNLVVNASSNSHSIPLARFVGLDIGDYSIVATTISDGVHKQVMSVAYTVHKPPTLHFVKIEPDVVNLPIEEPAQINGYWYVNGSDIDSIQGTFEIVDTDYTVSVCVQNTP